MHGSITAAPLHAFTVVSRSPWNTMAGTGSKRAGGVAVEDLPTRCFITANAEAQRIGVRYKLIAVRIRSVRLV
jgi:hypothetical protein